jgi:hypothetical protein
VIRWLRAWGPALICAALFFYASSRTGLSLPLGGGRDKLAHFAAYSVFGFALGHAGAYSRLPIAVTVAIGSLYALSDEVHQSFVPGRSTEFGDWLADSIGVLAGLAAYQYARRLRSRSGARPGAGNSTDP